MNSALPINGFKVVLQKTIKTVIEHFTNYRFDLLAHTLYEFIWNEFCDWYLEFSKAILNHPESTETLKAGTRLTLLTTLETLLRLTHPIMPFITEEIWQRIAPLIGKQGKTILLEPYPKPEMSTIHAKAIAQIDWLKGVVTAIRNIRSEFNILPNKLLPAILYGKPENKTLLEQNMTLLKSVSKLNQVSWVDQKTEIPPSVSGFFDGLEIFIPMENTIDKTAELERLNKELTKNLKEIKTSENKLKNTEYVKKAPPEVVESERYKLEKLKKTLKLLEQQIESLKG